MKPIVDYAAFESLDIRVGTVLDAKEFSKAKKPAYQLIIDFGGEIGTKRSSAQITNLYQPQTLIGKQVIAIINFAPKQIGPWISECLILGVTNPDGVVLLTLDRPSENGIIVH
jgi:tRNA-binding protein